MNHKQSLQKIRKTALVSLALSVAVLTAGCDTDPRGELANTEPLGTMDEHIEPAPPLDDGIPDDIHAAASADSELAEHPEMEMNNTQPRSETELADTQYAAVSFNADSTELTDASKEALHGITDELDPEKPIAVTVQVAEPKAKPDEPLTDEAHARAENVKSFLEDQGLEIARWTLLEQTPTQPVADPKTSDAQHLFLYIVVQNARVSAASEGF